MDFKTRLQRLSESTVEIAVVATCALVLTFGALFTPITNSVHATPKTKEAIAVLAKWDDPTSIPHTRTKCVDWAKPWPGAKICKGWKTQTRGIVNRLELRVKFPNAPKARKSIEHCAKTSAVVGVVAGVTSGGTSALPAAKKALKICLVHELGENLGGVTLKIKSKRTKWR